MEKKLIYMDNAATTPVKPEVLDAMLPYFTEKFGNPSSIYSISSENKKAITDAREVIAKTINTTPENIYFTAGGSESDNWALKATADAYASKGKHIITTKIEHHAVLHTAQYLERRGFEVTYVNVDENGVRSIVPNYQQNADALSQFIYGQTRVRTTPEPETTPEAATEPPAEG